MARRSVGFVAITLLALGLFVAPGLAQDGPGRGHGPPEGDEEICDERHNNLRSKADPIELDEGDVVAKTSDPAQDNFDEEFVFWRVDHGKEYDRAVYRESARLGPDNFCLTGSEVGAFWFGVSAPDEDGVQHEIDHQGQATLYFEVDDGEWLSLTAQFDGQGNLRDVNGVEPE